MTATVFPGLFFSHGAPNMALHDTPVRRFMSGLGRDYPRPDAIVAISAHFETTGTAVVTDASPGMIYDFRGFEPELNEAQYPAPGNPELALEISGLIESAGIPVEKIPERGFDHGTWVPFSLVWPEADISVVQVSIDPAATPEYHYNLGRALSRLPERNIAIVGTGQITHNLRALFTKGQDQELDQNINDWVAEFVRWFDQQLEEGSVEELLNYRESAPFAAENHPTDEHLLPIFVNMGAAGEQYRAKKIHDSVTYDWLAMNAYEFRPA